MNLIDRYVHQVGKKLPKNQRKDVEEELRSLLQDMVEDRAQTKVEQADEEIVMDVLLEMGSPDIVASSYRDEKQYLVGPQLWPIFKLVMTVVTAVFGGIFLFGIVVAAFNSDNILRELVRLTLRAIPEYISTILSLFGVIVAIFAILERTLPEESLREGEEETWHPKDLPEINDPAQIDRGELIVGAIFIIGLLVYLNGYPEWAGIIHFDGDERYTVPMLSANFFANLLPWLNLLLAVSLGVDLYQLFLGRKTNTVRWMEIGSALLTIVVANIFFTRGPIFGLSPDLLAAQGWDASNPVPEGFVNLISLLNTLARLGLIGLIIGEAISIVKKVIEISQTSDDLVRTVRVGKKETST